MKPRLICVGDSITAGQYVKPGEGWPFQLPSGISNRLVPFASSGQTTRIALEHFPAVQRTVSKGDVVCFQFGFNDANRWESDRGLPRVHAQAFRWNLAELAFRAYAFGASEVVYLTTFATGRADRYNMDLVAYDEMMYRAAESSGATMCDIRAELPEGLLQADGLHLTAAGHKVYAGVVLPVVEHALALVAC